MTDAMVRTATVLIALVAGAGEVPARQSPTGTLVVANMEDNTASIIDVTSGEEVANLPTGPGPHEVAISHDGMWAAISNYGDQDSVGTTVTIINVRTAFVAKVLDLDEHERPHGISFLPGDTTIAVTSQVRQAVVIVDIDTGEVVRELSTGAPASHMLAMTPDGSRIYTTNVTPGTISKLNVGEAKLVGTVPIAGLVEAIAVTPSGDRVWVGSNAEGTVSVVDIRTDTVIGVLTGFERPYRIAFTSDSSLAVITDPPSGTVRLVDAATLERVATIDVPAEEIVATTEFPGSASPEGIAIPTDGRVVYITLQGRNQVAEIDLELREIVRTMDTGRWPDGVGFSPVGTRH